MAITKYDPFQDWPDFRHPFRMFEDTVARLLSEPRSQRPWTPAVDIFETENELVLKADLPEVDMNFSLPDTVEADKVSADYKAGVLTVTLPKKEIAKPRTVKVQVH